MAEKSPTEVKERPCGVCYGSGREKRYDGVGGSWTEKCWQCQGRGRVFVLE